MALINMVAAPWIHGESLGLRGDLCQWLGEPGQDAARQRGGAIGRVFGPSARTEGSGQVPVLARVRP